MVLANVSDGSTERFDLNDADQYQALQKLLRAGQVSALSILYNGSQHVLPRPSRFREALVYGVELLRNGSTKPIGERIFAHVGAVRVSVTLTYTSKLVRCDLVRLGRMKYNPR